MYTPRFAAACLVAVLGALAAPVGAQDFNQFTIQGTFEVAHQGPEPGHPAYIAVLTAVPGETPDRQEITFECAPPLTGICMALQAQSCIGFSGHVRPVINPVTGYAQNPYVVDSAPYTLPPGSCY